MKKLLINTLLVVIATVTLGSGSVLAQTRVIVNGGTTDPAPVTTPAATTPNTTNTITPCGDNCKLGYTPLEPIPGLTDNSNVKYDLTTSTGFANLISAVFKILISIGALLSVVSLTIGGVQYMVSGSVALKGRAIERVKASMWGMLLIAGIWLILNTLNPNLLKFNFNPCPTNSSTCSSMSYTQTTNNTAGSLPAGTVNGRGTALDSVATVGTITGDQMRAANAALGLDGGILGRGLAMDQVLLYDPSNLSSTNSAAINAFTSQCQSDFASNVTFGYTNTHSVAIVPGSIVGASGESAMVCINN